MSQKKVPIPLISCAMLTQLEERPMTCKNFFRNARTSSDLAQILLLNVNCYLIVATS